MTRDQVFLASLTGLLAGGSYYKETAIEFATSIADTLIAGGGVVIVIGKGYTVDAAIRCDCEKDASSVFHEWCIQNKESPHSKSFSWREFTNIVMNKEQT